MLGCCFSIATSMRKSCTLLRLLHSPFKRLLPSKAWQGFHAVSLDCEIMWNWNRVEIRVPVASRAKQALSGLWQCHKPPWNHPRALVRGCQMSRISAAGTKIRVISLMSISFLILWMGSLTFRLLWDVEEGTNQRFRRLNIYNLNALMTLGMTPLQEKLQEIHCYPGTMHHDGSPLDQFPPLRHQPRGDELLELVFLQHAPVCHVALAVLAVTLTVRQCVHYMEKSTLHKE